MSERPSAAGVDLRPSSAIYRCRPSPSCRPCRCADENSEGSREHARDIGVAADRVGVEQRDVREVVGRRSGPRTRCTGRQGRQDRTPRTWSWPNRSRASRCAGPYPDRVMERFGIVGLPNAGKSSLFNALTGGNARSLRIRSPRPRPTSVSAKVPDHRLDALAGDERVEEGRARDRPSSSTSPASRRARTRARGWATSSSAASARSTPSLYVLRAFVDPNVVGASDPLDDLRDARARARARRRRERRDAARTPAQGGEVRQVACRGRSPSSRRRSASCRRRCRSTEPGCPPTRSTALAAVLPHHREAGAGGREPRRGPARRGRRDRRVGRRRSSAVRPRCSRRACSSRPRPRSSTADERAELLDGLGLGEGRAAAGDRTRRTTCSGLRTFLTTGDKESRARGRSAPEPRHPSAQA